VSLQDQVITAVRIVPPIVFGEPAQVLVQMSGESEMIQLAAFFPGELSIKKSKLIGMTAQEARNYLDTEIERVR
jgi:putative sterol carrier protein